MATMPNLKCINCNIRLSRIRRHALSDESDILVNTIRLWTYPRELTASDHICHACWELATHRSTSSENILIRQVGHQHVCIVCGRSILRINRHRVLIDGANEDNKEYLMLYLIGFNHSSSPQMMRLVYHVGFEHQELEIYHWCHQM